MSTAPSNDALRTVNAVVTTSWPLTSAFKRFMPHKVRGTPPDIAVKSARPGGDGIGVMVTVTYVCDTRNAVDEIMALVTVKSQGTATRTVVGWLNSKPISDGKPHDAEVLAVEYRSVPDGTDPRLTARPGQISCRSGETAVVIVNLDGEAIGSGNMAGGTISTSRARAADAAVLVLGS